jgi:hypothetical protein
VAPQRYSTKFENSHRRKILIKEELNKKIRMCPFVSKQFHDSIALKYSAK